MGQVDAPQVEPVLGPAAFGGLPLLRRHRPAAFVRLLLLGRPGVLLPLFRKSPGLDGGQACLLFVLGLLVGVAGEAHRDGRSGQQGNPRQRRQPGDQRAASHPLRCASPGSERAGPGRLVVQEAGQVIGQVQGAGVAPGRPLLQTFQTDGLQVTRHAGHQPRGRQRLGLDHLDQRLQRGGALEGRPAREALVQDRSQRINVGGFLDLLVASAGLLRGHVGGGAHDRPRQRLALLHIEALGQPKIRHLGNTGV